MNNIVFDKFRYVIIETSAICNLRCKMCPTLNYQNWFGVMQDNIFNKIIDEIESVEYIGLEGWGEPFLDNKIIDRIKKSKIKAKTVALTSNATLIDKIDMNKLKESGLDKLNVSIDGGSRYIYEKIRKGSCYDNVITNIKQLRKHNINISFTCVITRINYKDINNVIQLASNLGVVELTLKPNDVISSREILELAVPEKKLIETFQNAEQFISENDLNIQLHSWNIFHEKHPKNNCLANPLEAIFINYKGDISPCCNLGHPVPRIKKKILGIETVTNTFLSYGNITTQNMYEIWRKKEYVNFRKNIFEMALPDGCKLCNMF